MKIRNNLSAWLYFLPSLIFVIWRISANKGISIFDISIIIIFAFTAFLNIKPIQYIRQILLFLVGLLTLIGTMPLFWSANDDVAIFIALFLLVSLIMLSISEYQWHKKLKTNVKKTILIFSLFILYFSFNFYHYIENTKADNVAKIICRQANKYKSISELNQSLTQETINRLYTKQARTEQFENSVLVHYYTIVRPFALFSDAFVSCEIKTDIQGNIISQEIK